ncbi:MAG: DMT family transporter [Verrucomicrobia bacterium]|nr:DMT family transporter [Verrucomicrobiota bacterium]MBS0636059.1 DMT family transporter [Verrucomicrobiota bacterium]
MIYVVLLYALFASIFTASKQALEYAPPFFLVGARMCMAAIFMLGFCLFKKESLRITSKSVKKLLGLALFNIYLTNVFEFWGLQYLTSFKTCFIYSLSPFLSALLSYFIFSEAMTRKKWTGLVVGFLGFIPILLSKTSQEELAGDFLIFSWAELAVIGAAVASVYGWILLKQLINEEGYSPVKANGLSMLIGGTLALGHSLFSENWNPTPIHGPILPFLECTIFLIIVSNCIAYNLYGYLLKRFSATFMSFAGLTTPLFSALFGWIFHSEVPTISFYISFLIVFSGLYLFYQEELSKQTSLPQRATT